MLEELKFLFENYLQESTEVRKNTHGMAGYMGMGSDPKQHPCHMEFYNRVGQWEDRFLASSPGREEAKAAAEYILQAADLHRGTDAYWYYFACHKYAEPLLDLLTKEDCRELMAYYDAHYPKRERLPIHVQLYKTLKKRSK